MMKYMFVPTIEIVPEWEQCYYDSKTLQKLINLSKKSSNIIDNLRKSILKSKSNIKQSRNNLIQITEFERQSRYQFKLTKIVQKSHEIFYKFSLNEMQNLHNFIQLKLFSLKAKVHRLRNYSQFVEKGNSNLAILFENAYIQVYYLKKMLYFNKYQESLMVREYELSLKDHEILSVSKTYQRGIDRLQKHVIQMELNLENLYKTKQNFSHQKMRELIHFGDQDTQNTSKESHRIGLVMGMLFTAFAVVMFLKQHYNINIDTNKTYQVDFPIFRGASYFVAFQWIMGFTLLFLQKTHLNYKLILNLQGRCLPKSKSLFVDAAVTTFIFLIIIGLYIMEMAKVINTGFRYFGQVLWLVQIAYFFIPLPFTYYQGKLYFLKLVISTILSPFAFMKSSFTLLWFSQQLVSFSQPFSDFAYTICKTNDANAKCDMADVTLAILVSLFSLRVIVNTKLLNQKGWILIAPYFGLFRAFSAIITAITSYLYRKYLTDGLFGIFITSVILSTACAIYADLRGDWGLLQANFLRRKLFYKSRSFYYVCIIVDILLRCNWSLNLSPSIVNSMGILPFYLIMIVTYLELVRRGIWNIFWLQCWHLQNCDKFNATIDDSESQKRINAVYSKQLGLTINWSIPNQQQELRQRSQFELVTQKIRKRKQLKQKIQDFVQNSEQQINTIQRQMQQQNKK